MCNSGRSALGQADGKYLRSRQSLVTPMGGFCTQPPPYSCPGTCYSPKIPGAESCASPRPAAIFSPGLGSNSSGLGEKTAPTGSPALLGGDEVRSISGLHKSLATHWPHRNSMKKVLEPHFRVQGQRSKGLAQEHNCWTWTQVYQISNTLVFLMLPLLSLGKFREIHIQDPPSTGFLSSAWAWSLKELRFQANTIFPWF